MPDPIVLFVSYQTYNLGNMLKHTPDNHMDLEEGTICLILESIFLAVIYVIMISQRCVNGSW